MTFSRCCNTCCIHDKTVGYGILLLLNVVNVRKFSGAVSTYELYLVFCMVHVFLLCVGVYTVYCVYRPETDYD